MGLKKDAPIVGRVAVEAHMRARYPPGSLLVVDKLSDGAASGGFSWHREADGGAGKSGLRGVTYVELDGEGAISYVQEGYEPLFKLGVLLEAIFKLAAKAAKPEDTLAGGKPRGFEPATPTTAEGIVRYLWEVAYPGGAEPAEALRFFADDCVYEDLNYPKAFVGLDAITAYLNLIPDIPNVVFVPQRISEGEVACAYTWKVVVNGKDGPNGISFKEVDGRGKVRYNRDIPAPEWPRPLGRLAGRLRPRLRTFRSRGSVPTMCGAEAPSVLETVTSRPSRAAMVAVWLGFSAYVAAFAPGDFLSDGDAALISEAIADPGAMNPYFFSIFNALGLLPAVNAALLLPGAKEQRPLPTAPFVAASFALGYGGIGPYLALRQPRPAPVARSELGFFARYVTESRVYAAGLVAASLVLAGAVVAPADPAAAAAEFARLFGTSKLVHVSTIDLGVLSAFAFEPIREDMARRGWWNEADPAEGRLTRLLAFALVPVLGPCAYLLARPALRE